MSAESDFRNMLLARAQLTALVPAARIAINAVEQGQPLPIVVFTSDATPLTGLDGNVQITQVAFTVQCWAQTAVAAKAVADQVVAAIDASSVYAVTGGPSGTYDQELKCDGFVVTCDIFIQP